MRRTIPVTVLIPAYNAEQFLRSAVDTVRSQSVNVEEILVVDDASSDGTAALAERLGVRVLRASHGGPAAARNAGLAIAKSEWIATLDADDIWHPRKLELQYDAVLVQPELGLVFTDFDAVAVSDGRIHKANVVSDYRSFKNVKRTRLTQASSLLDFDEFLKELPRRSIVLPSTALFRRDLALEIGGFPAEVKAEDTEFFLRLAARTKTAFVDLPLLGYIRHSSQITANWELDPVRLELYHHVMANESRYHTLVVSGFRKQYAKLLYFAAANAAKKRRTAASVAMLAKAVAVAISRGEFPALFLTVAESDTLSGVFGARSSTSARSFDDSTIDEIVIPWRAIKPA